MQNDKEIFESMILGGVIGATLGAILTNKNDGSAIGAIAGAAILATLKASENAQKTNIPVLIEENNVIYEVNSNGEKKVIRKITKSSTAIPGQFKLK